MSRLTLKEAEEIAEAALDAAVRDGLKPVAISVLDNGGHPIAIKRQDGATFFRVDIATAKAWTAIALAGPSRSFATMADARPQFATSLVAISQGHMAPAAGGVTILRDGELVGSIGVSGDTSDNDEAAAIEAIRTAGLTPGE